ncbi:MAG: Maf family protein, partial [Chloroflexi bacterium]|nr:Maf family protein [Chloroflexota bacterium]
MVATGRPRKDSTRGVLTLASASPRRRELIRALDVDVRVATSNIEEGEPLDGEAPEEYVRRLALAKARQVAKEVKKGVVLGADTTVELDGEALAKPADAAEAVSMLERLRGRPHNVLTGVAVVDARSGRWLSSVKSSGVLMRGYS